MSENIQPRENKAKRIGITIALGLYTIGACAFINSPGEVQLAICGITALTTALAGGIAFRKPIMEINKINREQWEAFYQANPEERPEVKRANKEKEKKEAKVYAGHKRALRTTIFPTKPTILQAANVYFTSRGAEKARAKYVIGQEADKSNK